MKRVVAPKSKSYEHRILICELLSKLGEADTLDAQGGLREASEQRSEAYRTSEDIMATKDCISKIQLSLKDGKSEVVLDCNQSGSTLRFLLPIVCALGLKARFLMRGRLGKRPMDELINELKAHGCNIDRENDTICTSGKLEHGIFKLPGDISSQYISGLLMALPLLSSDSEIHVRRPIVSAGYIDVTLDVMRKFSISVSEESSGSEYIYRIKGGQRYILPEKYIVEGDWSNAAFWFAVGVLGDEHLAIEGLNPNSLQGDRKIFDILREMGADVRAEIDNDKAVFEAYPLEDKALKALALDAENIPDLVPLIAILACFTDGKSKITGIKRLRLKESDRLLAIEELIDGLGGSFKIHEDAIEISGLGAGAMLRGGEVRCFDDHRIVMSAVASSLRCREDVLIDNAFAVNKSYLGFFDELDRLGLSSKCIRK
mgnify:FL=1